jgi:hypothetical protein
VGRTTGAMIREEIGQITDGERMTEEKDGERMMAVEKDGEVMEEKDGGMVREIK